MPSDIWYHGMLFVQGEKEEIVEWFLLPVLLPIRNQLVVKSN